MKWCLKFSNYQKAWRNKYDSYIRDCKTTRENHFTTLYIKCSTHLSDGIFWKKTNFVRLSR